MQCKDIPTLPILEMLDERTWSTWFEHIPECMPSVRDAMPPNIPDALILAKMYGLIHKGLVSGCACGCRGDYTITEKGIRRRDELRGLCDLVIIDDPINNKAQFRSSAHQQELANWFESSGVESHSVFVTIIRDE